MNGGGGSQRKAWGLVGSGKEREASAIRWWIPSSACTQLNLLWLGFLLAISISLGIEVGLLPEALYTISLSMHPSTAAFLFH